MTPVEQTRTRGPVRLQVELEPEKVRELEGMMEAGHVRTKKDLINSALTLLKWAMNEVKRGRIIASVDEKEDTYKQLVMPVLEAVGDRASSASAERMA
jgi:hypothetical protein